MARIRQVARNLTPIASLKTKRFEPHHLNTGRPDLHFMSGVREIRQIDDVHTHWILEIAGQPREFDATITEQHPDERIAWKSDAGPDHAGVITFHRLDDSHTRVTAQMDIDPDGFVENIADKLGVLTHRVKKDMGSFKEFIESRDQETGAWRGNIERPDQIRPDEV